MKESIRQKERECKVLEPGPEIRRKLLKEVTAYAETFLSELPVKKAYQKFQPGSPTPESFTISESPVQMEEILETLDRHVDNPGLNPASGGHLGYIPGGGIYPSSLGDFLADIFNRYAGVYYASPGAVDLENYLLRWMCGILGYPEQSLGNLTSGGSMANLIAISTARSAKGIKAVNIPETVIYLSPQAHHSLAKSINIAGLGEAIIRHIPLNKRFQIEEGELQNLIKKDEEAGLKPFLVISSAGTTDTGAVDPLEKISEISNDHNLWHHVDGAYGGFFILTQKGKKLFQGIEKADSITIDPHKGLFLPYGSGAVLIKEGSHLKKANEYQASYLQDTENFSEVSSPADLSPELSKHFRGLRAWIPLKLFGLAPFKAALEEKLLLSRYFFSELKKRNGFETPVSPDLTVVPFRYVPERGDPDDFNRRILKKVLEDGRIFLSSTRISGKFYLRIAVLSFRTHLKEIDLTLDLISKAVSELAP